MDTLNDNDVFTFTGKQLKDLFGDSLVSLKKELSKYQVKEKREKDKKGEKFIMFEIHNNCGYDMKGKYFVQKTGNEEALEKFRKINKKNYAIINFMRKNIYGRIFKN